MVVAKRAPSAVRTFLALCLCFKVFWLLLMLRHGSSFLLVRFAFSPFVRDRYRVRFCQAGQHMQCQPRVRMQSLPNPCSLPIGTKNESDLFFFRDCSFPQLHWAIAGGRPLAP